MESSATPLPATTQNDTTATQSKTYPSHKWEFLVAVLVAAISVSIVIALLAKCQVIRRYLASYRHTRLREIETVSQRDSSGLQVEFDMRGGHGVNPRSFPSMSEEDDDGFIEDNYIPASERARAERAAQDLDLEADTEEEMEEVEFSIT